MVASEHSYPLSHLAGPEHLPLPLVAEFFVALQALFLLVSASVVVGSGTS